MLTQDKTPDPDSDPDWTAKGRNRVWPIQKFGARSNERKQLFAPLFRFK